MDDLVAMGFDRERVQLVCRRSPGNMEAQLELLDRLDRIPAGQVASLVSIGYSDALCRLALWESRGSLEEAAARLMESAPPAGQQQPARQQPARQQPADPQRSRTVSVDRPVGAEVGWVRTEGDLFVNEVHAGSPAAKAGVRPGWQIVRIAGISVSNGAECKSVLKGQGSTFSVSLYLPPTREIVVLRRGSETIGLTVNEYPDSHILLVVGTTAGGPAHRSGINAVVGWRLTHVQSTPVSTMAQLYEMVRQLAEGQSLRMVFSSETVLHPPCPTLSPQPSFSDEQFGEEIHRLMQEHREGKLSAEALTVAQSALRQRMKRELLPGSPVQPQPTAAARAQPPAARPPQPAAARPQQREAAGGGAEELFADFSAFQTAPPVSPAAAAVTAPSPSAASTTSSVHLPLDVFAQPPVALPPVSAHAVAQPTANAETESLREQLAAARAELERRGERLAAYKRRQQVWLQQRDQQFTALTAELKHVQEVRGGGQHTSGSIAQLLTPVGTPELCESLSAELGRAVAESRHLAESFTARDTLLKDFAEAFAECTDSDHAPEPARSDALEALRAESRAAGDRAEKKKASLAALLAIGDESLAEAVQKLRTELHGLERTTLAVDEQAQRTEVAGVQGAWNERFARAAESLSHAAAAASALDRRLQGTPHLSKLADTAEASVRVGIVRTEGLARAAVTALAATEASEVSTEAARAQLEKAITWSPA